MHRPDAENVYSIIGFTLTSLQSFERSTKFCTRFVLQDKEALTWERLQRLEREEGKKALGHFLGLLRQRSSLHPKFEELLVSVLRDRNDFIHNTDQIAGWDLSNPEGLRIVTAYCLSLIRRVHQIQEILGTLFAQWQQQARIEVPTSPDEDAYFAELERKYGNLIEPLFAHREA